MMRKFYIFKDLSMAEGTPVRDYVLKMMGHLNELQVVGAEIDRET